jgi:hypothetical protein
MFRVESIFSEYPVTWRMMRLGSAHLSTKNMLVLQLNTLYISATAHAFVCVCVCETKGHSHQIAQQMLTKCIVCNRGQ